MFKNSKLQANKTITNIKNACCRPQVVCVENIFQNTLNKEKINLVEKYLF